MKLQDSTNISQVSGPAESDSEADHELEMRLYSELYFDHNPDFIPLDTKPSPEYSSSQNDHSQNQTTESNLPSSTESLENVSNTLPVDPEVSKGTANFQSSTNGLPQEGMDGCLKVAIKTALHDNTDCVQLERLSPLKPSSNADCKSSREGLSPVKNLQVSTPTGRPYVFSMKSALCEEKTDASKCDSVEFLALSSTPIGDMHRPHVQDCKSYGNSEAKPAKNIKRECLKMPRKRISTFNTWQEMNKKPKIDDVISISSSSSDDEASVSDSKRGRDNTNISSFLSELKRKVGLQVSPTNLNTKAKKKSLVKQQRTTFVAGDSTDSNESIANDALGCNFSLEFEGNDTNVSKSSTAQNKRVDWPLDYSSTRKVNSRKPSVEHWTPHMASFYDSDFSEDYEINHLQRSMPDDMMEWEMEADDFVDHPFGGRGRPRYFDQKQGRRCKRCRAYDHTLAQCRKLDYCHLCGDTSHFGREMCPNNCCFRCGREYHTFCPHTCPWNRCEVCHNKGHIKQLCPDLWRRYAFTTQGTVPVEPGPRSNRSSVRLPTCFSCGQAGHLGPDCAHRVQNYVVLHQEVQSYALPTRNCLGMTVLTEDLQEQPEEVDELYGETVQRYTAVRASVSLDSSQVGYIIGKKGNVINALRKLFACNISIMEDERNPNSHLMWLKGTRLDEALRCILFLLNRDADLTGVRDNMAQLDLLTDTKYFTQLWRRKMREFRRSMHEMNEKKAKKEKAAQSSSKTVYEVSSDSDASIQCISDDEGEKTRSKEFKKNPQDEKVNLKRGRDEDEEEEEDYDSNPDSDLEIKIKSSIALKKSKTIFDCEDSKYAAFDKLKTGKDNRRTALASLDPQNCYSSDESDSHSRDENDSDDSSISDDDCEIETSYEDSELASDVSSDEMSFDDPKLFKLSVAKNVEKKLNAQKAKRFNLLLQNLPMGRKSLIHAVNEKLAKTNEPIDVESCVAKIKMKCLAYRENKSDDTLTCIRDTLEKLGAYVLGYKGMGNEKKKLRRLIGALERSTSKVASHDKRRELAMALSRILRVDLGSLKYVIGLAEKFMKGKENKTKTNTSVHSRLSFPKKSNESYKKSPNQSVRNQRQEWSKKSLKNFRTFESIEDIAELEEQLTSALTRDSQFHRKRKISTKKKAFRSKSQGRSPTPHKRGASRSPKDFRNGKQRSFKTASSKKSFKDKFKVKSKGFKNRSTSKSPHGKRK